MAYLIDIDGTLLDGPNAIRGAVPFIEKLADHGAGFLVMTNSVLPVEAIHQRLQTAGFSIAPQKILTPIVSINAYLSKQGITRTFTVGSPSDIDAIRATQDEDSPQAVVLVDFERPNLGYATIQKVFSLMQAGVPVLSASGSRFYRRGDALQVDTGAFVALFESLLSSKVLVLGKPSPEYFNIARAKLGSEASDLVVVGDDWQTDMVGAQSIGASGILVRSGKYLEGDENRVPGTKLVDRLDEIIVQQAKSG